MAKAGTAVFLGATGNIAFSAANTVIGLERHNPTFADKIIVFYDGWSEGDMDALRSISPKVEFRPYNLSNFPESFKEAYATQSWAARTFTHMVHCKYEIFNLLDEFQSVLWLDCDVLVQRDIYGIRAFAPFSMKPVTALRTQLYASAPGFDDDIPAYNSGVIFATDEIAYQGLADRCYELLVEHHDNLKMIDQAVFAMALHRAGIPVAALDIAYNYKPNSVDVPNAAIVHANLPHGKFWKSALAALLFPEWWQNDARWKEAGGTPFTGTMTQLHRYSPSIKASFDILENSLFWERLYPNLVPLLHPAIYPHFDLSKRYWVFHLKDRPRADVFYTIERISSHYRMNFIVKPDAGIDARSAILSMSGMRLVEVNGYRAVTDVPLGGDIAAAFEQFVSLTAVFAAQPEETIAPSQA